MDEHADADADVDARVGGCDDEHVDGDAHGHVSEHVNAGGARVDERVRAGEHVATSLLICSRHACLYRRRLFRIHHR